MLLWMLFGATLALAQGGPPADGPTLPPAANPPVTPGPAAATTNPGASRSAGGTQAGPTQTGEVRASYVGVYEWIDIWTVPVTEGEIISVDTDNGATGAQTVIRLFDDVGTNVAVFSGDKACTNEVVSPNQWGCAQGEWTVPAGVTNLRVGVSAYDGSSGVADYSVAIKIGNRPFRDPPSTSDFLLINQVGDNSFSGYMPIDNPDLADRWWVTVEPGQPMVLLAQNSASGEQLVFRVRNEAGEELARVASGRDCAENSANPSAATECPFGVVYAPEGTTRLDVMLQGEGGNQIDSEYTAAILTPWTASQFAMKDIQTRKAVPVDDSSVIEDEVRISQLLPDGNRGNLFAALYHVTAPAGANVRVLLDNASAGASDIDTLWFNQQGDFVAWLGEEWGCSTRSEPAEVGGSYFDEGRFGCPDYDVGLAPEETGFYVGAVAYNGTEGPAKFSLQAFLEDGTPATITKNFDEYYFGPQASERLIRPSLRSASEQVEFADIYRVEANAGDVINVFTENGLSGPNVVVRFLDTDGNELSSYWTGNRVCRLAADFPWQQASLWGTDGPFCHDVDFVVPELDPSGSTQIDVAVSAYFGYDSVAAYAAMISVNQLPLTIEPIVQNTKLIDTRDTFSGTVTVSSDGPVIADRWRVPVQTGGQPLFLYADNDSSGVQLDFEIRDQYGNLHYVAGEDWACSTPTLPLEAGGSFEDGRLGCPDGVVILDDILLGQVIDVALVATGGDGSSDTANYVAAISSPITVPDIISPELSTPTIEDAPVEDPFSIFDTNAPKNSIPGAQQFVDEWRMDVYAGQDVRVIVDTVALDNQLDPRVWVYDNVGRLLAAGNDEWGCTFAPSASPGAGCPDVRLTVPAGANELRIMVGGHVPSPYSPGDQYRLSVWADDVPGDPYVVDTGAFLLDERPVGSYTVDEYGFKQWDVLLEAGDVVEWELDNDRDGAAVDFYLVPLEFDEELGSRQTGPGYVFSADDWACSYLTTELGVNGPFADGRNGCARGTYEVSSSTFGIWTTRRMWRLVAVPVGNRDVDRSFRAYITVNGNPIDYADTRTNAAKSKLYTVGPDGEEYCLVRPPVYDVNQGNIYPFVVPCHTYLWDADMTRKVDATDDRGNDLYQWWNTRPSNARWWLATLSEGVITQTETTIGITFARYGTNLDRSYWTRILGKFVHPYANFNFAPGCLNCEKYYTCPVVDWTVGVDDVSFIVANTLVPESLITEECPRWSTIPSLGFAGAPQRQGQYNQYPYFNSQFLGGGGGDSGL